MTNAFRWAAGTACLALLFAAEARADDAALDLVPVRAPHPDHLRFDVIPTARPEPERGACSILCGGDASAATARRPSTCDVPCGWRFEVTIPVWIPGVTGTFASGDATIDTDGGGDGALEGLLPDVATSLELAFAGRLTARTGPWTLVLDGLYASIDDSIDWRIRGEDTEGNLDASLVRFYAVWQTRVPLGCDPCSPCLAVGPLVGARGYHVGLDVDGASGADVHRTKSWVDPIVGVRADLALAGGTTFALIADVGGSPGGSDLSWSVSLEVGVPLGGRWSLLLGWTLLDIDYTVGSGSAEFETNLRLSGPSLGITYRF